MAFKYILLLNHNYSNYPKFFLLPSEVPKMFTFTLWTELKVLKSS